MAEYLVPCKVCGNQVSNKAKVCPHCGKKLKMALWLKIIIAIFAIGIFNGIIANLSGGSTSSGTSSSVTTGANTDSVQTTVELRPENQIAFEDVILQYSKEFDKAQNELQESVCRNDRKKAISALNMGNNITNWIGTLDTLGTNGEGKAHITIRLNSNLDISTWNNALSDIGDNTLIEMDSDLYKVLYNMKRGQKVKFSGSLIKSDNDFYKEKSITIRGSMKSSDFLMKFTDVQPLN